MIEPPPLARLLLEATLAASDRDVVMGDLCEEFRVYVVPSRGVIFARWWYRWQAIRSLYPLFVRSWERASLQRASAALMGAALVATVPASLLIVLRTFVLQQVPLKTTAEPSLAFTLTLLAVV
jgi:hypothetical protein